MDFASFLTATVVPGFGRKDSLGRTTVVTTTAGRGTRGLLVHARSGKGGVPGSLVSEVTGQEIAPITETDVALLQARTLFVCPPGSRQAFALHECFLGVRPGIPLAEHVKSAWDGPSRRITMIPSWVESSDEFLRDAQLKAVEVRKHNASLGTATSANAVIGTLGVSATAPRGQFFPSAIKDAILNREIKVQDFVAVRVEDADQQILDLKWGDTTKRFVLERGNLPKVALVLPDGLEDDEFVERALVALAEAMGVSLDSNICS